MMSPDLDSLSIIVPLHNEQENVNELRIQICDAIRNLPVQDVEILLIDDGSTDDTPAMIDAIVASDPRFQVITLSRNFGHQAAVTVGLQHSTGKIVAIIDGDLQDPPAEIANLVEAIFAGADVAYGVRRKRKEGWLKRIAYASFYRLLRKISDIDIPSDSGDFCCMRRCVVDAVQQLPERNRFVRGLRAWVGFKQTAVPYERAARFAGEPAYTWTKLLRLALDGFFSFTSLPVRATQLIGFVISFSAIAIAGLYLVAYLLHPELFPPGFATVTISIWLLAGTQLFFLGLLGEYIVRTFDEVRRRPTAVVARVCKNPTLSQIADSPVEGAAPNRLGQIATGVAPHGPRIEPTSDIGCLIDNLMNAVNDPGKYADELEDLIADAEAFLGRTGERQHDHLVDAVEPQSPPVCPHQP